MIKAIIFDFGGVILDLNKRHTLSIPQALSVLFEIPVDEALRLWRGNRDGILTGKETPAKFLERINLQLRSNNSTDELLKEWNIMNTKDKELIDWEVMTFIEELRQRYKVYILSDATALGQDDEFSKEIETKFDEVFLSYREGYKKPGKDAFLNVLKKTHLKPEECIFIDDSEENVIAAKSLGIKSIKYINLAQFKQKLETLGISV